MLSVDEYVLYFAFVLAFKDSLSCVSCRRSVSMCFLLVVIYNFAVLSAICSFNTHNNEQNLKLEKIFVAGQKERASVCFRPYNILAF